MPVAFSVLGRTGEEKQNPSPFFTLVIRFRNSAVTAFLHSLSITFTRSFFVLFSIFNKIDLVNFCPYSLVLPDSVLCTLSVLTDSRI